MPNGLVHARHRRRHEVDTVAALKEILASGESMCDYVLHAIDLRGFPDEAWGEADLDGVLCLGCRFDNLTQRRKVEDRGAYVFPALTNLPYRPFRNALYTVEELMDGYDRGGYTSTRDFKIFTHFDRARRQGYGVSIRETLAQRIHDHSIDDALQELIQLKRGRGVVGIMGGHGTLRTDPYYRKVAYLTWELTRRGYFIASGGGPGIMEAANLGAYLSNYANPKIIDEALRIMSPAAKFDGGEREGTPEYLEAMRRFIALAREVTQTFQGPAVDAQLVRTFAREREAPGESLAVPTWFYGHEPSNLFSTYIAKYFANSIREDGLLAISVGGVVYAPGSAGTLQEVFMDLAQNHYATFDFRSPMVFLHKDQFDNVLHLLSGFVAEKPERYEQYGDMIASFDDPIDVADYIEANPPREREHSTPLYELVEVSEFEEE